MNKEQCRLCLCTTYNLAGISSSIKDASFEAIIKNVFCFALPTYATVGEQKNDLPVLVCFQCSNTIRHFHYFSEHVKANQKKLQSISVENQQIAKPNDPISDNWSLDELIQHIKRESEVDATGQIATYADIEGHTFASESREATYDSPLALTEAHTCVEKDELAGTLQTMDKRVDSVTKQLRLLTRNLAYSQRLTTKPRSDRRVSFEFSPITNVEDLDSFNQQLSDEDYRAKVLDWLDVNIDANDSHSRMHQSLDLMFDRAFLAGCNWTGVSRTSSKKLGFKKYTYVTKLIQTIGGTDTATVTAAELEHFLKNKFYHAKARVKISRSRTTCHKIRRKTVNEFKQVSSS